jgi:hypothetical protein
MEHAVCTVISYCSNDYRFIHKCIEEAKRFSSQILIPVCDHFFDGTPENRDLLEWTYAQHPGCRFIEFSYLPDRLYSRYHSMGPNDLDWAMYWTATARYIGYFYLDPAIEWILFLDSDEVIEGDRFLQWLDRKDYLQFDAQRFASYLYAVRSDLRAKKAVNLPLFAKKKALPPNLLLNPLDRLGAFLAHPGTKRHKIAHPDGNPFMHHYSWVRTKEECYRKASTWAHRNDQDWHALIEESFKKNPKQYFDLPFEFETIAQPFFDPLAVEIPSSSPLEKGSPLKIDDKDLFRKEILAQL